jgi:hypothetical protein
VVLTVLFEVGLGRLVLGLPWDRITEDYDPAGSRASTSSKGRSLGPGARRPSGVGDVPVQDALTLKDWPERFDKVIDSGLFHVFSDDDRHRYAEGLATALKPGGRLFLMCFSDEGPGRAMQNEGRKSTQPGEAGCLTGPQGEPICYSNCYKFRLLQSRLT